jgi:hypothetical protein
MVFLSRDDELSVERLEGTGQPGGRTFATG